MIHDILKILYLRQGYLGETVYRLISDEEMFDAFIKLDEPVDMNLNISKYFGKSFFFDNYPYAGYDTDLLTKEVYVHLVNTVAEVVTQCKSGAEVPEWLYPYMVGSVVGPQSSKLDIHDFLVLIDDDNSDDIFSPSAARSCVDESIRVAHNSRIDHYSDITGPLTIFGDLNMIRNLRIRKLIEVPS